MDQLFSQKSFFLGAGVAANQPVFGKGKNDMRKIITAVVAPLLLALSALPSVAAPVEQDYDGSLIQFASQNDTTTGGIGDFAKIYDNFKLGVTTNITGVHWIGGYFNVDPDVGNGTIESFQIQIWDTVTGEPGASIYSATILGNAGETETGLVSESYKYAVVLADAFVAQAGVEYWLSIQANMPFPPQWGWGTSGQGDGVSYQDFDGDRSLNTVPDENNVPVGVDMAFSLTSTPTAIPEPGSLMLAGLALAALFSTTRAKKAA